MQTKTREYFDAISRYVVNPLRSSGLGEHCFASALLVFGAIDGLGRLVHEDRNAGSGQRFREFLPRLGDSYVTHAKALWKLRNSLAHNATNFAAFMSKAEGAELQHLEEDRGRIFVHTKILAQDFSNAFDALRIELESDAMLSDRVEKRLAYADLTDPTWRKAEVKTTEPFPLQFVQGPEA